MDSNIATATALGRHEEAIGSFEQQLAALEQLGGASPDQDLERGRAYGNLGTCYRSLGDEDEAVTWLDKYLAISLESQSAKDQDKAYRELGAAHKNLGNLQQALVSECSISKHGSGTLRLKRRSLISYRR